MLLDPASILRIALFGFRHFPLLALVVAEYNQNFFGKERALRVLPFGKSRTPTTPQRRFRGA
jgi:hypothetical protein